MAWRRRSARCSAPPWRPPSGRSNLRRGVSQVFLNLARRNQALLHRQLTLLDAMQRQAREPEALDDLFQLDHLTTRMRRHAEGLIILSGAAPGRAWRKPVPVLDVVRAAVAEVEDYTRVNVLPLPEAHISGTAVADVIHLIAELIENATIYSPPQTKVQIRGDSVANGFVVEIEDRGLGLTPEEYQAVNDRLANPPEFDLADSDRLGLFVVSRLANRNGVSVVLRSSPYGGTTAIALIPKSLMVDGTEPVTDAGPGSPAGADVPRARHGGGAPYQPPALAAGPVGDRRAEGSPSFAPSGTRSPDSVPSLTVVPNISDTGPIDTSALRGARGPRDAGDAENGSGGRPPATPGRTPPSKGTHRGLPRRVRQANMAPQLRETTGPLGAPTPPAETEWPVSADAKSSVRTGDPDPSERSPDDARAMFSAFQQGGRRGRMEAEQDAAAGGPGIDEAQDKGGTGNAPAGLDIYAGSENQDRTNARLSRGDDENPVPDGESENAGRATTRPGERDQKHDLRNHSEGYVHQTNGEKGDE